MSGKYIATGAELKLRSGEKKLNIGKGIMLLRYQDRCLAFELLLLEIRIFDR